MKRTRIINVDGHKCKFTLLKGKIKENDLVISKHRFDRMDENGIYDPIFFSPFDVKIEQAVLGWVDGYSEMVLGFKNGGVCYKALDGMYSLVNVELV